MAHQGQKITNPRTGQTMVFETLTADLLRVESVNPVAGEREPLHVYPLQESGAEIVSGTLIFEVDGGRRHSKPRPGDSAKLTSIFAAERVDRVRKPPAPTPVPPEQHLSVVGRENCQRVVRDDEHA